MEKAFNSETLENIDPKGSLDEDLAIMVQYGGPKLVKALLEAGASPTAEFTDSKGRFGRSALTLALNRETDEVARLLVDYGATDNWAAGALIAEVAVAGFDSWLIELLAENPVFTTGSSKSLGCANIKFIEPLLAAGASPSKDASSIYSPLAYVLSNCNDENRLERLKRLLEIGIDPNVVNNLGGETALMLAARGGLRRKRQYDPHWHLDFEADINYLEILLNYGADPNIIDNQGRNALMPHQDHDGDYNPLQDYKRRNQHPSIETIKVLLASDAKLIADSKGVTPLMEVFRSYQEYEKANNIAKIYLSYGADIEAKDNWGRTALMYAVTNGNFEGTKLLLENGADILELFPYKEIAVLSPSSITS